MFVDTTSEATYLNLVNKKAKFNKKIVSSCFLYFDDIIFVLHNKYSTLATRKIMFYLWYNKVLSHGNS